jgi:hypothetical protein
MKKIVLGLFIGVLAFMTACEKQDDNGHKNGGRCGMQGCRSCCR